jgi:hypothetical protein
MEDKGGEIGMARTGERGRGRGKGGRKREGAGKLAPQNRKS